ncbi:CSC1-like protein RXW8 isoform X2 [Mercurialis annua]|uniref:CSC1-like protein RXW8 isoform X2 n=1 Tax=Mercurialis annua TaxID=3986 RepID=UPI0024AFFF3F|nr:CSC1-like protein RXW8 isoform X2 [Mercurialis annua]
MDIAALLTSAGINVGICIVLFGLYSVLRKQPSNRVVYFGRRLASVRLRSSDVFSIERFVPSPSWIVKAWETTEEEILSIGGLDALVFQRMLIFSIRVFSIAAIICLLLVLPMNYYGKDMEHKYIASESLHVFTIGNVKEGSRWLWAHCLALYIISCAACVLLYFEYKSITEMRLAHITKSSLNPGHFTILVRSVPWCPEESFNDTVKKFFTNYYPSSYLSHQMVYRRSIIRKLMLDAEKMCSLIIPVPVDRPSLRPCCLCGKTTASFKILASEAETAKDCISFADLNVATRENECAAAFVFFKTRCSAVVATQMLQSPNPMLWVTELAPEPHDVLWSKISIPYKQLWLRKIGTLLASIVFMFVFLIPVTFVQGLTQLDKLSKMFPFLRGLLKKKIMSQVLTGYLPSVILMLFLYSVPPVMMVFSSVEGPFSRSGRKKSAALKILYFTIWNVFFVNILSGSVINQLTVFTSVKEIPMQLAKAIPTQILNVYIPKYEGGGHFWPIFHNTTIFSLVLTQVIALGVFGIKESPIASGFIFPLVFFTLLFNEYCRQRFYPIFVKDPIQILIEMDRDDEQSGRMEEIHTQLRSAYCQFPITAHHFCESVLSSETHQLKSAKDPEEAKSGKEISEGSETWADVNFEKES